MEAETGGEYLPSSHERTHRPVTATKEITKTENMSTKDNSTEKRTNVACVRDDGTSQIQINKTTVKVNYVEGKKCDLLVLLDTGSPV